MRIQVRHDKSNLDGNKGVQMLHVSVLIYLNVT